MNDDEAVPLLRYCREHGYQLRFIEQMPLDPQSTGGAHGDRRGDPGADGHRVRPDAEPQPARAAPAERWRVDSGPAEVRVIALVTRPFCEACDRTRLTADGALRNCLFSQAETDLRGPMRAPAPGNEELAGVWRATIWAKLAGHQINVAGFPSECEVGTRRAVTQPTD